MSVDPTSIKKESHPRGGRFVYKFGDGSEAEMAYAEQAPGVVGILHTETPLKHRGQGVAAQIMARAVEIFRTEGLKVVPLCSFARAQFSAHPEWADLLYRR